MTATHPRHLRDISLKWKLLIPFLLLPAVLTVFLVVWAAYSLLQTLTGQEEVRIRDAYQYLQNRLELQLDFAAGLAEVAAADPAVQKAVAERDRETLKTLYLPIYQDLKRRVGVKQLHFHGYPPRSLIRLHQLDRYGDDLSDRLTILMTYETGETVSGMEVGLTGFGLRGVAPVYYQGHLVGTVEFGIGLENSFLERFKKDYGIDLTLYRFDPDASFPFHVLATTAPDRAHRAAMVYRTAMIDGTVTFQTTSGRDGNVAYLVGPLRNYTGHVAAVAELSRDRTEVLNQARFRIGQLAGAGLVSLLFSLLFVWRIARLFLAPIRVMVDQAEKITRGERAFQVQVVARDEFGTLAEALNRMLASLEGTQRKLRNQARDLEIRVQERTMELLQSEEKFRTLVDQIPLVVYRLEPGLIRSFVNSHIETLTGWPPEDQVGGPAVWSAAIHPRHRAQVVDAKARCLETGAVLDIEYALQDRRGREVDVLDHAVPILDDAGQVRYLEGYMIDIREQKRLREQTVKAEELKTLGEISSRLAHEFRNPISILGLSARRLTKTLGEASPATPYAQIMLEQTGRLEGIMNAIQTYLRPMGLERTLVSGAAFFRSLAEAAAGPVKTKDITLRLNLPEKQPDLYMDPVLMERALINLIRNAVYQMPRRGVLTLQVTTGLKTTEIHLVYPAGYLPDDQLRHFFYPFTTEEADVHLVDLPLAPVIVHKHGGVIQVGREGDDLVAVTITLPMDQVGEEKP